jgi:DNA-binding FadR family transcriptional regulator
MDEQKQIEERLSPVTRENLHEKIVAQLKTLIFSKEIKPGQKLPPERALTEQFRVSRTVVREALKSLSQSGLVEIRTGATGGAFVADNLHMPLFRATYDLFKSGQLTFSHFCEARKAIECSSIRMATEKATSRDLENLRALNEKLRRDLDATVKVSEMQMRGHNTAFHVAIAEISGNPLIKVIVRSVMDLIGALHTGKTKTGTKAFMRNACDRHEAIIKAMETKDLVLCEQLMAVDTEFTRNLISVKNKSRQ